MIKFLHNIATPFDHGASHSNYNVPVLPLSLRCFEMLKDEWGEVNNITSTWKHWYQIEPAHPPANQQFIQLADILHEIPPLIVKQWLVKSQLIIPVPGYLSHRGSS